MCAQPQCRCWLCRIEAREKKARYSRAQDVARRRAADELRNSRRGEQPWWERVSAGFANLGAMAASYVEVRCHTASCCCFQLCHWLSIDS
jgi:hypothetical protein